MARKADLILYAAAARAALLRGIALMTGLMRPTLGPTARTVAIAPIGGSGSPEVLDSAATIARRTIQLADPFEDMGAMLIRNLALRVADRTGDGAATAAVLAEALVRAGSVCIAAGCSPTSLRQGVEYGVVAARAALEQQAISIETPAEIAAVVGTSLGDPLLAAMVAEVVDSVGPEGTVLFENAPEPESSCEYVDGLRWNEGYLSYFMLKPGETTARLLNPRILVTDQCVERVDQLVPALEACVADGDRSLLVIAPEVRDSAIGLLVMNRERGVLDSALAVKAPSFGVQQTRILEDIATTTGGRCVHAELGEALANVTSHDLGRARQAWATSVSFGIVGGQGCREDIHARIADVKAEWSATVDDPHLRQKLKERIGNLSGTCAVVRVGARTPDAQAEVRLRLEAAVTAARLALEHGVVPGGGAALLGCIPSLECSLLTGDEGTGVRILAQALVEPMRVILANAGLEPEPIVHEGRSRGPGWSYDVLQGDWTHLSSGGLADPLAVTLAALEGGASAAIMALTAEALVHHQTHD